MATASGEVLQQNNYYPFGKQFNMSTSPADIPFKFSGKEYYSENGMYDFAARQYDPKFCRFTSADPLAKKYFSISPYAYCNNNPVIFVDPDGKDNFIFENGKYVRTVPTNGLPQIINSFTDKGEVYIASFGFER